MGRQPMRETLMVAQLNEARHLLSLAVIMASRRRFKMALVLQRKGLQAIPSASLNNLGEEHVPQLRAIAGLAARVSAELGARKSVA